MIKRLFQYLRKNLSARVGLWVVLFASIIFLLAFGFIFFQSRVAVRNEAFSRAEEVLDNTVQRVTALLDRVETAANNMAWLIPRHLDAPDSMFVYSRRILENNPELNGCSIAFEPYYFKERGKYFSAFSLNDGNSIQTTQEGNENYEYFTMDWYQLVKLLGRPSWTEPFFDYNPNNIYSKDMIASYCRPILDKEGRYVGTMSVDISLNWLSETISAVKPYPNSYSIMTGLGGTFFVHPDSTKLFYQTIFTETLDHEDPARSALGYAMQRGESGRKLLTVAGKENYVFYKPLADTGWSVAIVCPESDIFAGLNRMQHVVLFICILGLLLMLFVCSRIVSRELKPLSHLTHQIEVISSGELDKALPDNRRIDELGRLYQSFSNMQRSLVSYIQEMRQTTAAKAAIENELKVASDIQMSMVPRIFPAFPNRKDIDLFASMTPAKEVGGDLYDYFVQNEHLYFCVGDVSGKGVPASLFMAQATRLFRTLATQHMMPAEIATRMNAALSEEDNEHGMFVTMFIGLLDLNTGRLNFCNAGHNPPVLMTKNDTPDKSLREADFIHMLPNAPIGLWPGLEFEGEVIENIKTHPIFIYTDGLNEAENKRQEQLGDDKILEILRHTHFQNTRQVIETMKAEVEKHRQGAEPNDDLTMMCLSIKS